MDDLTAFITARLDEDEAMAKAAAEVDSLDRDDCSGNWTADDIGQMTRWSYQADEHIARHDPARVLREVTAKRAILGRHKRNQHYRVPAIVECEWCTDDRAPYDWPCPDIRAIAATWNDHPDYQPQWAPEAAP